MRDEKGRFVKGHKPWHAGQNRGPLSGRKFNEEHKRKISKALKINNAMRKPEVRKKLSEAHKGKKLSEEHKAKLKGRIPWNKGQKGGFSEETIKLMSKSHKGKFCGKRFDRTGLKHKDETIVKLREAAYKRIKDQGYVAKVSKDFTSIEKVILKELNKRGIQVCPQYQIDWYFVDFVIPEKRIAIECDGDYWHSLPNNKRIDRSKEVYLQRRGWTLLRFSEHEINEGASVCVDKIEGAILSKRADGDGVPDFLDEASLGIPVTVSKRNYAGW